MAITFERSGKGFTAILARSSLTYLTVFVLFVFWGCVLFESVLPSLQFVRYLAGALLVLFLPGALVTGVLGIERESGWRFVTAAVGSSFAFAAIITLIVSVSLPRLGFGTPLSILPLAIVFSTFLLVLVTIGYVRSFDGPSITLEPLDLGPIHALYLLLPVSAAIGAATMNRWGSNVGMFLFVGLLVAAVVSTSRFVDEPFYPTAIFLVSISLLLHRNLLGSWIVGADIQAIYAVAHHVFTLGSWSPGVVETPVPTVSVVPAVVSKISGLSVVTTFRTLYVFAFSLVPVGLYYVGRDVFDRDVALYGALFFQFYHLSFIFTPGKQLVSELFVVLLLLAILNDGASVPRAIAIGLFSVGLILTHYGMTYAFGTALLLATVGLAIGRRRFSRIDRPVSIVYPVLLLGIATAWYLYAAPGIVETIGSFPTLVADQIRGLFGGGPVGGSGASVVTGQRTIGDTIRLSLYALFTAFVAVGIGRRAVVHIDRLRRGDDPGRIEYTALAVPLFVLLGSSYFLVLNLWAARVYQLVLVVLAPFMAYGFATIHSVAGGVYSRVRSGTRSPRPYWTVLAVLLAVLLAFNSGMVFALTGSAETSTFNPDGNDLVFRDGELAGAEWLEQRPAIERTALSRNPGGAPPIGAARDRVRVFTDPYTAQLLRAVLSQRFYDVEVVLLKSRWRPSFERSDIGQGYVFVRKRSIVTQSRDGATPPTYISHAEIDVIQASGHVVFENEDVIIYETDGGAGS